MGNQTIVCDNHTMVCGNHTKVCGSASRIQDMDVKDDADIIAINLGTNDALNATVEGHALLGAKSAIDKIKHDLNNKHIICSVPPTRNKYANGTRRMINDYLQFECSRNPERMHFVDTQITMTDIGRDAIHLKPTGKEKLWRAIIGASMDFSQTGKRAAT